MALSKRKRGSLDFLGIVSSWFKSIPISASISLLSINDKASSSLCRTLELNRPAN